MTKRKARALVLFSGGLDSGLAIKLLQEQGIEVIAVFFLLPFIKKQVPEIQNTKLHIIDCTKGKLLQNYLEIIKKPKYSRGTAFNPCIDCRIFMLKEAKKLMKKLKTDFIATGEVLGERPLSQSAWAMQTIEQEAGLQGKLLRPLSAKLLPETEAEKKKLVDRDKLLDIQGRQRKKQIEFAEKYKISYPMPAGGCLLCEPELSKRLKYLLDNKEIKKITQTDIELFKIGRHFTQTGKIILGRNKEENEKLEELNKKLNKKTRYIELEAVSHGPSALVENGKDKQDIKLAAELIAAYSDGNEGDEIKIKIKNKKSDKIIEKKKQKRERFEKYRI